MSEAFSNDSETVLRRVVNVTSKTSTPVDKLQELYQIEETCDFIKEGKFEKVRSSCKRITVTALEEAMNDDESVHRLLCSFLMSCWWIQLQ